MPPRTDGVFVLRESAGDSFIRFLPDGRVVSAATTGEEAVHDVLEWLLPGHAIAAAAVSVEGDRIEWTERLGDGPDDLVEYRGSYGDDHLLLEESSARSHVSNRRYEFVSASAAAEARAARSAKRAERSANAKAARAAKKPRN